MANISNFKCAIGGKVDAVREVLKYFNPNNKECFYRTSMDEILFKLDTDGYRKIIFTGSYAYSIGHTMMINEHKTLKTLSDDHNVAIEISGGGVESDILEYYLIGKGTIIHKVKESNYFTFSDEDHNFNKFCKRYNLNPSNNIVLSKYKNMVFSGLNSISGVDLYFVDAILDTYDDVNINAVLDIMSIFTK